MANVQELARAIERDRISRAQAYAIDGLGHVQVAPPSLTATLIDGPMDDEDPTVWAHAVIASALIEPKLTPHAIGELSAAVRGLLVECVVQSGGYAAHYREGAAGESPETLLRRAIQGYYRAQFERLYAGVAAGFRRSAGIANALATQGPVLPQLIHPSLFEVGIGSRITDILASVRSATAGILDAYEAMRPQLLETAGQIISQMNATNAGLARMEDQLNPLLRGLASNPDLTRGFRLPTKLLDSNGRELAPAQQSASFIDVPVTPNVIRPIENLSPDEPTPDWWLPEETFRRHLSTVRRIATGEYADIYIRMGHVSVDELRSALESLLRRTIVRLVTGLYGDSWPDHLFPNGGAKTWEKAKQRYREEAQVVPGMNPDLDPPAALLLAYMDFPILLNIVIADEHWTQGFDILGCDRSLLTYWFTPLHWARRSGAHSRQLPPAAMIVFLTAAFEIARVILPLCEDDPIPQFNA